MRKLLSQPIWGVCSDAECSVVACKLVQLLQENVQFKFLAVADQIEHPSECKVDIASFLLLARLCEKSNVVADKGIESLFRASEQVFDLAPVCIVQESLFLLGESH